MSLIKSDLRLILAAKTNGLPEDLQHESKFLPMTHEDALAALENAGLWYGPRAFLEECELYRQIIPYIVLHRGGKIVRYTRTPKGGEARLHGRYSIGLGGHIDLADVAVDGDKISLKDTLQKAADRELQEELGSATTNPIEWLGLMVEHDSAVGRVHIGVIGIGHLREDDSAEIEDSIGDLASVTLEQLQTDFERLEGWSQKLLPWLQANPEAVTK